MSFVVQEILPSAKEIISMKKIIVVRFVSYLLKAIETMIFTYKNILLIFCLLMAATLLANPQAQFEAANAAYQKGDYPVAIDNYEQVLKTGNFSDEVYYNLGNAYFKTNQIGKAILNYERAALITPRDEDVKFNLDIANAKKKDDLGTVGKFFVTEWWQGLHKLFSSGIWGGLTLLSLWAGIAGFILWLFGESRDHKKQGFIGGIVLTLLSILLYFVTSSQATFENNSGQAIVLVNKVALKNGPDKISSDVLEIHEGLKVELLDQIGDWYKVKLSNGDQGWLPTNSLEEI